MKAGTLPRCGALVALALAMVMLSPAADGQSIPASIVVAGRAARNFT